MIGTVLTTRLTGGLEGRYVGCTVVVARTPSSLSRNLAKCPTL